MFNQLYIGGMEEEEKGAMMILMNMQLKKQE